MSDEKQVIAQNISLLLSQNRSAEARAELDRLLAMDGEDPESRSLAGDVYAWTGAHGAAYKNYNLAADIFNRLGRADQALGVHHKILDLDTSMLDAATQARIRLLTLLVSAEDALVTGQNEKAVAGYSEAIRQFPNHTITYQRLASLLVRMGRHAEAVQQYLTVGRAFYGHGVLPKARPYFERVLELQADQSEALEAVLRCLDAEDKAAEGVRFLKAAVQASLEQGAIENAAAWFERLPDAGADAATPMGAALLLQSGELSQADRMAGKLELQKPELSDWFKHMGRASLDRGDSLSADVYFRWSNGTAQPELPPEAPLVEAAAPEATPEPFVEAAAPEPEPEVEPAPTPPVQVHIETLPPLEVPAPLAVLAPPPPGLGLPPPPPPPAGLGVPAPPPPQMPVASTLQTPDDRAILQTMGEMCLAEEMFEEAKQVFERLTRSEPNKELYWDLLNKARSGLGLSPVSMAPVAAPAPVLPPPPPPVLVEEKPASLSTSAGQALVEAKAEPEAVAEAPAPAPLPPPALPPLAPPPLKAFVPPAPSPQPALPGLLDPPPAPSRPEIEPMGRRSSTPSKPGSGVERPAVEWSDSPYAVGTPETVEKVTHPEAQPKPVEATKVLVAATFTPAVTALNQIQRHAFTVQLGELPPSVPSAVDAADEIIE